MSQDFKYNYWYSYKGEGPITWDQLPNRIRLSNGFTRTDKETFTQDELRDAGYASVDRYPNYNDETHVCYWDGTAWGFSPHHIAGEELESSDN
jgi:hypothetical protein